MRDAAVGSTPLVARAGAVVVEVDLDFAGRATEMVGVDSICTAVARVVDVVDAGTIFTGVADATLAVGVGDCGAEVTNAGAVAARGAVAADLNMPRLSTKQYMEPKVMCIPLYRSAYTERWAGGWKAYSKEPKQMGSRVVQTSIFIADGAGATMIPTLDVFPTDGAN